MEDEKITLAHGSGGKLTKDLIEEYFVPLFDNDYLSALTDSAIISFPSKRIAFTTDSFVVSPLFFPGGNIGKLAVCGTVNDLCAGFARPLFLSCSFIIEEGFLLKDLKTILSSMKEAADEAGVLIVTGDTKVVEKGKGDGIFINTSGVGEVLLPENFTQEIRKGDKIIITGSMGDHGGCIISLRSGISLESYLESDCAPLQEIISLLHNSGIIPAFLRDPTRGGVAQTLNDIVEKGDIGVIIYEENIPIKNEVKGICELLGLEPFHLANEGKMIIVVRGSEAEKAVSVIKECKYGKSARIIGEITDEFKKKVVVQTPYGGKKVLDRPVSEPLPRIC